MFILSVKVNYENSFRKFQKTKEHSNIVSTFKALMCYLMISFLFPGATSYGRSGNRNFRGCLFDWKLSVLVYIVRVTRWEGSYFPRTPFLDHNVEKAILFKIVWRSNDYTARDEMTPAVPETRAVSFASCQLWTYRVTLRNNVWSWVFKRLRVTI